MLELLMSGSTAVLLLLLLRYHVLRLQVRGATGKGGATGGGEGGGPELRGEGRAGRDAWSGASRVRLTRGSSSCLGPSTISVSPGKENHTEGSLHLWFLPINPHPLRFSPPFILPQH